MPAGEALRGAVRALARGMSEATLDMTSPRVSMGGSEARSRSELGVLFAFPVALLMAVASLGGLLWPGTYARETASWTAQAVGQDWADLLIAVPWLLVAGVLARAGSRRALLVLGGGYLYTIYEFAIYAFAVRFNALFLVYCAVPPSSSPSGS